MLSGQCRVTHCRASEKESAALHSHHHSRYTLHCCCTAYVRARQRIVRTVPSIMPVWVNQPRPAAAPHLRPLGLGHEAEQRILHEQQPKARTALGTYARWITRCRRPRRTFGRSGSAGSSRTRDPTGASTTNIGSQMYLRAMPPLAYLRCRACMHLH